MASIFDRDGSPVAELAEAMDAHHLLEEQQPQMEGTPEAMSTNEISVRGDLIDLLQCFFCSKMLQRPISVCENGHSCCGNCKGRLRLCGFCKGNFVAGRNFLVENLLERFSVRCAHFEAGCQEYVKICDFLDHSNRCEYNPNPPAPEEESLVDENEDVEFEQMFRNRVEPFDVADDNFWRQEFSREDNDFYLNTNNNHHHDVDVRISLTVDRVGNNAPAQVDQGILPSSVSAGREGFDLQRDFSTPSLSSSRTEDEALGRYHAGAAAGDAGRLRQTTGDGSTRVPSNLWGRERPSDLPWLISRDNDRTFLRQPANISRRGPGPAFRLSPSRRHRVDRNRSNSSNLRGTSSSAAQPAPFVEQSSHTSLGRGYSGRHSGAQQRARAAARYMHMPFVSNVRPLAGASTRGHEEFRGYQNDSYDMERQLPEQSAWLRSAMMQPRGRHSIAGGPLDTFFHPIHSEIPVVFLEPAIPNTNGFRI